MKRELPWDLIISKLKEEITDDDNRRLSEWLSDSANREVYEELQEVWLKVCTKVIDYTPDTDYYWKELMCRMEAGQYKASGRVKAETKKEKFYFRRYAAVACVAIAIFLSASFYIGVKIGRPELAQQTYSNWGGKSEVSLPDGTSVWIHSKTSLAYNTNFQSKDRIVNLTGEAYFDVAHDKNKPFVVQTEGMKVIVHGTKFNIESFSNSENTLVSLEEGSVSLETEKEQRFLHPGEVATFNKRSHNLQIEEGDVTLAVSWANDQMMFRDKPLNEICRFLSKWYNVKIILSPELHGKFRYTFTLRHEPLEEILRIMSRINPISYEFNDENTLTILPKKK